MVGVITKLSKMLINRNLLKVKISTSKFSNEEVEKSIDRVIDKEYYDVSSAQERIYVLSEKYKNGKSNFTYWYAQNWNNFNPICN